MKYTKKQIQESIAHWQKVLESMDEADTGTYSLELDVSGEKYDSHGEWIGIMTEDELSKFLTRIAKKYHLTFKILTMSGSGGGSPAVDFIGTKANLKNMYTKWYDKDDEYASTDFEDFFNQAAKPVA